MIIVGLLKIGEKNEVKYMPELIPNIEERQDIYKMLMNLPENESMFKCYHCRSIFDIRQERVLPVMFALIDKNDIRCSECKSNDVELMCKADAYSTVLKAKGLVDCRKGIMINGADICPICRSSMCPECWNHSVVSWSRITGYLNDVSGWNLAKKQELIDRKRYTIAGVIQ